MKMLNQSKVGSLTGKLPHHSGSRDMNGYAPKRILGLCLMGLYTFDALLWSNI